MLHSAPQPSSLEPAQRRRAGPRPGMLTFGRQGAFLALPLPTLLAPVPGLVCSWHLASSEFLAYALLTAVPTAWTLCCTLPCLSPIQLLADLQGLAQAPPKGGLHSQSRVAGLLCRLLPALLPLITDPRSFPAFPVRIRICNSTFVGMPSTSPTGP